MPARNLIMFLVNEEAAFFNRQCTCFSKIRMPNSKPICQTFGHGSFYGWEVLQYSTPICFFLGVQRAHFFINGSWIVSRVDQNWHFESNYVNVIDLCILKDAFYKISQL